MRAERTISVLEVVGKLLSAAAAALAQVRSTADPGAVPAQLALLELLSVAEKQLPPEAVAMQSPCGDAGPRSLAERHALLRAKGFTCPALISMHSPGRTGPHLVIVNGLVLRLPLRFFVVALVFLKLAQRHSGVFFPSADVIRVIDALRAVASRGKMDQFCLDNLVPDDIHKALSALRVELRRLGGPAHLVQRSSLGYRLQGLPDDLSVEAIWLAGLPGFEEVFVRSVGAPAGGGVISR